MKKINVLGISLLMMVSLLSACGDKKTTISYEIKGNQVGDISINGKYTDTETKVVQEEVSGKEVISHYRLITKQTKDTQDQIKDPEYKVTLSVDKDGKVTSVQVNDKEVKDKALENGSSFEVSLTKDKESYHLETKIGQKKEEKEALEKVKKAIEILEKEKTRNNVDAALDAWKKLPELNQKYKKEVADKIKVIYEALLEEEAEKAVKMAEEKKSQSDIDLALKLIKKLPENKQSSYQKRIEAVKESMEGKKKTPSTGESSSTKKYYPTKKYTSSSSKGKSGGSKSGSKTTSNKKQKVCMTYDQVFDKYEAWVKQSHNLSNITYGDSDGDGCWVLYTNDGSFRAGED